MVCFIHRPEYYHLYSDEKTGKDLRGLGQIIVAKHRNGATDSVWLRFIGKYAKFQNENDAYEPDEQASATTGPHAERGMERYVGHEPDVTRRRTHGQWQRRGAVLNNKR